MLSCKNSWCVIEDGFSLRISKLSQKIREGAAVLIRKRWTYNCIYICAQLYIHLILSTSNLVKYKASNKCRHTTHAWAELREIQMSVRTEQQLFRSFHQKSPVIPVSGTGQVQLQTSARPECSWVSPLLIPNWGSTASNNTEPQTENWHRRSMQNNRYSDFLCKNINYRMGYASTY